jgi:putative transposase
MKSRKHIRLRDYNYASENSYFITVCVKSKQRLLGSINNGIMGFSAIGNIAALYLQRIEEMRAGIVLDEFVIMPNHIHCLITIKSHEFSVTDVNKFSQPARDSISTIVNRYKGAVKKWCNGNGYTHFQWQTRFYDRVIRDDDEFWAIRNYIKNNPVNWQQKRLA